MKVILLSDIAKIGRKYDIKEVSDGYASNYLLPRGLVELATPVKIKNINLKKKNIKDQEKLQHNLLEKNLEKLKGTTVILKFKANDQGHLYEKVHIKNLVEALKDQARINLDEKHIALKDPIKQTGEHVISIKEGKDKGSFTLIVEAI